MARDFSQNSNRSLRVAGQAMRRSLVSPGMAFRWRKQREGSQRRIEQRVCEDRDIIKRMREARRDRVIS